MSELTTSELLILRNQLESLIQKYDNMDALAKAIEEQQNLCNDIETAISNVKKLRFLKATKESCIKVLNKYNDSVHNTIIEFEKAIETEYHSSFDECKEIRKHISEKYCFKTALLYILVDLQESEDVEASIKEWDIIFASPEKSTEIQQMIDEAWMDAGRREKILRRIRTEHHDISAQNKCAFLTEKQISKKNDIEEEIMKRPKLSFQTFKELFTQERGDRS